MRSDLAVKVKDGLAEAGTEVPVPQHALHSHSVAKDVADQLTEARAALAGTR